MPAPPDDARSFRAQTVSVVPCGDDGVILRVRPEPAQPPLRAARFFMLKREDRLSPLIPRPFSLYRQPGGDLEFLIKVMGEGTRALAACAPGTSLRVIGPLGNGWPALPKDGPPPVLVAGGIGSAPFLMGIEQLLAGSHGNGRFTPSEVTFVFGAARSGLLYDHERFEALGVRCLYATDDGSKGLRGNVLDVLRAEQAAGRLPEQVRLLACGPDPMLAALERHARERELACWLSLETVMGCGVGICNGCPVTALEDGRFAGWPNAKCCVEGPVFSTRDVTLQHA